MNKLFIDESGVNSPPSNIWTHCAIFGDEKEINRKYEEIRKEVETFWPALKTRKELNYSSVPSDFREKVLAAVFKHDFDFVIVYCDGQTQSELGSNFGKPDNLRRHVAQCLILDAIKKGKKFSFVVFDKFPFSKANLKKLEKSISEKLRHDLTFSHPPSEKKPALQISDLLAGSTRAFLRKERHLTLFSNNKNIFLFQDTYRVIKLEYKSTLSEEGQKYCFEV